MPSSTDRDMLVKARNRILARDLTESTITHLRNINDCIASIDGEDNHLCPNCRTRGSSNLYKEVVFGCKSGDLVCTACGHIDTPGRFRVA